MTAPKTYRDLVKVLRRAGFELVQQRRNPHFAVFWKGERVGTLPLSGSDHRGARNDYARIRRNSGVDPLEEASRRKRRRKDR